MNRSLTVGFAVIVVLQALVTLIKVFEEYTDPYVYLVSNCLIAFDFFGNEIYCIGTILSGTKYGSGDEQTRFAVIGALNLVCLLGLYTLSVWCAASIRSAYRKHAKSV